MSFNCTCLITNRAHSHCINITQKVITKKTRKNFSITWLCPKCCSIVGDTITTFPRHVTAMRKPFTRFINESEDDCVILNWHGPSAWPNTKKKQMRKKMNCKIVEAKNKIWLSGWDWSKKKSLIAKINSIYIENWFRSHINKDATHKK